MNAPIGFSGLSHLGLNYSLATAAKGFDVVAFDPDAGLVAALVQGRFPIEEPGFTELHAAHRTRIRYTSNPADLSACTLVFFSLDVRTNDRNESDPAPLTRLMETTVPHLNGTAVVLSQVRPGFARTVACRIGPRIAWYYQVETLIFGAAVRRAMEPERFIVGAANPGAALPAPYREWLGAFGCPVLIMRYESAELAKIAINLFLVSSVSTTNTLAELCEAVGGDWSEIVPALRLDRRIGPHAYLKPGLGIAGGNLERDLVTTKGLAAAHRTEAGVVEAWQRNSAHAKSWAIRVLRRDLLSANPSARLAVWGLAYKPNTDSLKNSASIELIRSLATCPIQAYDPVARAESGQHPNLAVHSSPLDAANGADALVIMTPWEEFFTANASNLRGRLRGDLVVDPYGVLSRTACTAVGLRHVQIGLG